MKNSVKYPEPGKAKTWVLYRRTKEGTVLRAELARLVGRGKRQYLWKQQGDNPYLKKEILKSPTSRYRDVAMALSHC
jgi:hypothetical protein